MFEREQIFFFNALYTETNTEYNKFYNIAVEEYHNNVLGKAVQSFLQKCLLTIEGRKNEIYANANKKYIFDSLFKLLKKLFEVSRTWDGTSRERYINIDFCLSNKGLKHMMEYLDEKVILTTIHSSKGLEWDYVIIPQMNAGIFPSWGYMCKQCHEVNGDRMIKDCCINKFTVKMEKILKKNLVHIMLL